MKKKLFFIVSIIATLCISCKSNEDIVDPVSGEFKLAGTYWVSKEADDDIISLRFNKDGTLDVEYSSSMKTKYNYVPSGGHYSINHNEEKSDEFVAKFTATWNVSHLTNGGQETTTDFVNGTGEVFAFSGKNGTRYELFIGTQVTYSYGTLTGYSGYFNLSK